MPALQAGGQRFEPVILHQTFFKEKFMKAIKRKQIPKQRNPLVALVMFKKAGAHRKSNKALRKAENQRVRNSVG